MLSVAYNDGRLYRSNGIYRHKYGIHAQLIETSFRINLNPTWYENTDGWLVSEIIVYDRKLTHSEILQVEYFLNQKYGLIDYVPYQNDLFAWYNADSFRGDIWYNFNSFLFFFLIIFQL